MLLAASFLNYFDRQTLSVLKVTLEHTFHFEDASYALILNIFMTAYSIAYIVSGWVVDRVGVKRSLPLFAILWSAATIGCGAARSFLQLAIMRGLLGIAEPGVQPVTVRAAAAWAPVSTRGTFMTVCSLGSSLGAIAAPAVIAFLTIHYNWRLSFVLPGILGMLLAGIWWFTYREPRGGEQLSQNSLDLTAESLPWLALWRSPAMWGLLLARFIGDPVWYFVLFWMIGYLQEQKGATLEQVGRLGWIPFVAANVGGLLLVSLSDILIRSRRSSPPAMRKLVLTIVACAAPLCWLLPGTHSLGIAVALFSVLAVVSNTYLYMLSPLLAEVFPLGNVASIWGIIGAAGAVGVIIFNAVISHVPHTPTGTWALFLCIGLLHPLAALVLNLLVRTGSSGLPTES